MIGKLTWASIKQSDLCRGKEWHSNRIMPAFAELGQPGSLLVELEAQMLPCHSRCAPLPHGFTFQLRRKFEGKRSL